MSIARTSVFRSISTTVARPSIPRTLLAKSSRLYPHTSSSPAAVSRHMASAATAVKMDVSPKSVPAAEPWRCHYEEDPQTPRVYTFFEKVTSTWQYVLVDAKSSEAILIDTVLDYDPASGTISTATADSLLGFIRENKLTVTRIL